MRTVTRIGGALAVVALLAGAAAADENDRLTYLTFSGPVQLPGVTLAAGTYTFRLADPQGDRHVVQVLKKQDSKLITTLMTIPNKLMEAPKDPYVMFAERPAGSPPAMKAWFYPGNSIGEEFIYPHKQAIEIAKATHQPVLASEGETADKSSKVERIDEKGNVTSADASARSSQTATATADRKAADRTATATAPQSSAPAATTTAPRSQSSASAANQAAQSPVGTSGQATRTARRDRLPQTASPIALVELLSGLSLAGGFGLRQLLNRL